MDNASVNDVIVETVARCLLTRYGIPESSNMHIRCIAHVINLVVQDFLAGMDEADDPDIFDWFESNKEAPLHYDPATDPEQLALEKETDDDTIDLSLTPTEIEAKDDLEKDMAADNEMIEEEELEAISGQSAIKRVSSLFLLIFSLVLNITILVTVYHNENSLISPKAFALS